MSVVIIVLFFLLYVIARLFCARRGIVKKNAYKWWYLPLFAFVFALVMALVYHIADARHWILMRDIAVDSVAEAGFSLFCALIWTVLEIFVLRKDFVSERMLEWFRDRFTDETWDRDCVLPFPYFIDYRGEVRSRVGQIFYRWTIKAFLLLLFVTYAVYYALTILPNSDLLPFSGLGLLALLPLIDYYIFLCVDAPVESIADDTTDKNKKVWFENLWKYYVAKFNNYSVAWWNELSPDEVKRCKKIKKDNNKVWEEIWNDFFQRKLLGGIVTRCDMTEAFEQLDQFFARVESDGQYTLIAIDIPNHFSDDYKSTFLKLMAREMEKILHKEIVVFEEKSTDDTLNNSLVVTPLSLITRRANNPEWMKKIGLVTVINMFDKNVSNMYECRRFSYLLRSFNKDFRVLVVAPYRRDVQPSLQNIWHTGADFKEYSMQESPNGKWQFFIGYNYEDYKERYYKILSGITNEPLYSGSEMAYLALSSTIDGHEKDVVPIHYLELAYSNAIEGREEIRVFRGQIKDEYHLCDSDISKKTIEHLLPVEYRLGRDNQMLNVVFDTDNNATVAYTKWFHLGRVENFLIVVSKPYLFRDYFNANHCFFTKNPFSAIQPRMSKSRINLALVLLNMLRGGQGVEERELHDLLLIYYERDEIVSIPPLIKDLFSAYFNDNIANSLTTEESVCFNGSDYERRIIYKLAQYNNADLSYLDIVTVRDRAGNELFEIMRDMLEQNYTLGQIHAFYGRPFKICDFNAETNTLNVERVNNNNDDIIFYRQVLNVAIGKSRKAIKDMAPGKNTEEWTHPETKEKISITISGFETELTITPSSYYKFPKYTVKDSIQTNYAYNSRVYNRGKVLKISFKYLSQFNADIDDIRKSLQILLYESLQSVFPHHAQYLVIASKGDGDPDLPWIFSEIECDDNDESGVLSYYFAEDAHIDLGLIGALAIVDNIQYILRYLRDYLVWLNECGSVDPKKYSLFIANENLDKYSFLKYGREEMPKYFDVKNLIKFVECMLGNDSDAKKLTGDRQKELNLGDFCDFCGKKKSENESMQVLNDGRNRCSECSEDAVDTDEDLNKIVESVKQMFLEHLGIDFDKIPYTAKLVSAVDLHKLGGYRFNITSGYELRELVGLASNTQNGEFYVENGYKTDKTFGIVAHEMTHIWQYSDADFIKAKEKNEDLVEGLAVWTDLFLSEKYGVNNIEQLRESWLSRDDKYGRGLRFIMEHCPNDPYGYIKNGIKY